MMLFLATGGQIFKKNDKNDDDDGDDDDTQTCVFQSTAMRICNFVMMGFYALFVLLMLFKIFSLKRS
jgi:hypothetical protein